MVRVGPTFMYPVHAEDKDLGQKTIKQKCICIQAVKV